MASDDRFGKGFFSSMRLPVSRRYVRAAGRGRLYALGAVGAAVVAVLALGDAFAGDAGAIASGPLSDNHALFARDCAVCHTAMDGVPDVKCGSCHESARSDPGTFSFQRHYLYRSREFDRSAPASREISCAGCHGEHQGAELSLVRVEDAACRSCHTFGSFGDGHPDFDFAAEADVEQSNLKFPHVKHVLEVMDTRDVTGLEGACFQCHEPSPDGRSFEPISFARHCGDCHLGQSAGTPVLPVAGGGGPGVRTLAQIRAQADPASVWADYWNANEFTEIGGGVRKRPVYHEDPWVLDNLRLIRQQLYPGAELAGLLRASADLPPGTPVETLYREAIEALRARIDALRGEPSSVVQDELDGLSTLLAELERRVEDPATPLDETRFDITSTDRAAGLVTGEIDAAAWGAVVDSLTAACQTCHVVDRASIRRVQKDQSALLRAEFDHAAHVIHGNCLDCHAQIPIREYVEQGEEAPAEVDRSGIANLPTITDCQSCHTSGAAPVRCTSCHLFHPEPPNPLEANRYGH